MVTTGAPRRVDRRRHRGRGAAAGVLLDQGVRPALQRQVPRRQVLPVPRRHARRGVPAGAGRCAAPSARASATSARTRTPGRSARPSTCCCGSSRCAPARNGVFKRAGQIGRPCLLGYIGKCSAPCVGRVSAEEHRAIVEDFCDFMAGQTAAVRASGSSARCTPPPTSWTTSGPPGCATTSARSTGRWRSSAVVLGDGTDADVDRARRGRARGRRPGLPRPRRPGPRPARLGRRQGRGRRHRRAGRALPAPAVRRRGRRRDPARGAGAGAARRRRRARAAGSASCAAARSSIRVPQRGDKRDAAWRPSRATPSRRWCCTRPSGPAT